MDVKEEPPSAERREQAQPCDATRKTRKTGPKRKKAGCGDDGDGQAKRKRAKAAAEPVEKRLSSVGKTVPWRPHPNEKTRQRILRALPGSAHRMFLLEHKVVTPIGSPGGGVEEFVVLGATANGEMNNHRLYFLPHVSYSRRVVHDISYQHGVEHS
ncbi:unnamed protein product [Ostreobium quekettii]|uniref:Uncharacterized protein n=1 Tax=Ostreobium quekettii TaxID=121088 RepID=A0A8S1JAK0_9CHLO|nr:unnamed protein product [Ostreobium quekettii]